MTRTGTKQRCGVCRFPMHKTLAGHWECRRAEGGKPPKAVTKKRGEPRKGRFVDIPRLKWATTQVCCVTGRFPATTHHVRAFGGSKDDTSIIRLVRELHLHEAGMESIERLGKSKFEARWGIDIEAEIRKLASRYALAQKEDTGA